MFSPLRNALRTARTRFNIARFVHRWNQLRSRYGRPVGAGNQRNKAPVLVVIPSDPRTLVGARGDEAMLTAVRVEMQRRLPGLTATVLTESEEACKAATALKYSSKRILQLDLDDLVQQVLSMAPDFLVVIGADSMDGHYNPLRVVKILAVCDLLAHAGTKVVITGFSFVAKPSGYLRPSFFSKVSKDVLFNVRDNRSLERFQSYCDCSTQLVADVAFLLEPASTTQRFSAVEDWISTCQGRGKLVLGINLHPMLCADEQHHARLVEAAAQSIKIISEKCGAQFLLIPHDFREDVGDNRTLERIQALVPAEIAQSVYGAPTAAELKHLVSKLDGLLTGRMHLAIAALGVGVPVAAVTYAEKFEGLFDHFGFRPSPTISPVACTEGGQLQSFLWDFVSSLSSHRERVQHALPRVRALAEHNLRGLFDPHQPLS